MDGALRGGLIGVIGGVGEVHGDAGRVEILGWEGLGIEVLRVLRFGFGVGFGEMKPSVMADEVSGKVRIRDMVLKFS